MTEKKREKDAKKIVSEDVEKFFRDVWGKVVEYASLGAEEATKLSSTAKVRVDVETLKFKKGKVIKMLGERYLVLDIYKPFYSEDLDLCTRDSSLALPGTKEILREIKEIDKEIRTLEKEMKQAGKTEKPEKEKTTKTTAKKSPAGKTTVRKKTPAKKTAPKKQPAPEPKTEPAKIPQDTN